MDEQSVRRIDVVEAQDRFFELLDEVEAGGAFDLMKDGVVIGRLERPTAPRSTGTDQDRPKSAD